MPHKLLPTLFLSLVALTAIVPSSIAKKNKAIKQENTIENLLRHPKVYNMKMSPDGKYAASVAPMGDKGERGIVIFDLNDMSVKRSASWRGLDIDELHWTSNEDVTFSLSKWGAFVEGVYRLSVNEKTAKLLVKNDAVVRFLDPAPDQPFSWIWIRNGNKVKKGIAKLGSGRSGKVNKFDGSSEVPATNQNSMLSNRINELPGQTYWWHIDNDHEPRIVTRFHNDRLEYSHRYSQDEDWTTLPLEAEEWDIELFGNDKNLLYISGYNGENTKGLYPYNIDTGEIGELIFRDEFYDFSDSARYLRHENNVIGFRYMKDKPAFVWLAPELLSLQEMIDGALPGRANILYDSSADFNRHMIYSSSDNIPGEYILLDLKEKKLNSITKTAPWLVEEELASTQVFHFDTSDGLKLEGYLTIPNGKQGPHPMICLVHGGPWSRDTSDYDDETQFFASQGYAVLRVNYRGSTGYGKAVSQENAYEFRKMHNDITEAVKLTIDHGVADPDRIAIMGASFGGYAAICGAAFEPDLYTCAITNMGVFDWEEMIKSRKQQDRNGMRTRYSHHKLVEKLGNPKESSDKFHDISPIKHIDKVKIPIFVIHGKEDSNVSIKQSKMLKTELEKFGVVHQTHFVNDEGHNIFELKKRVKTYQLVLEFLNKHMK
ncbi:X-Pro dipeptidyl-peptidase (S15 family) [Verrucomicrobiia bacterium DG1235]|nr:X-Pro dipeptidyl-peptidase (S15 family) [Verrucomicrobiae bacterium DG1235]